MAGRLSAPGAVNAPSASNAHRRRRALALAALVLAVVALHACVTREIARRVEDFGVRQALPPRIAVTYVREMQLEAPPAAPPVVGEAPPALRPKRRAAKAAAGARPASAPPPAENVIEAQATVPMPEPTPESEPASAAASAPDAAPPPVAEAVPSSNAPGAAFEWPASTRVTYALTGNYRGEVNGDAQVEWVKAGTRYQVHIDMSVGPRSAPLIQRSMNSQGEMVGDRLVPDRYDEETRIIFRDTRRNTVTLGVDEIVLANGEKRPRTVDVQDSASQFVQLAALFAVRPDLLETGNSIEIMLALPRNVDLWIYDVVGPETLQTAFGPVEAVHLKPRRASRGPSDLSAEVWFAPQLRYMPARIRIRQDASTYVDLLVSKKPEIGAP